MNERFLNFTTVAELTKNWAEKAANWENNEPTVSELFQLAADVFDIRNSFGLTTLGNTDISTTSTSLILTEPQSESSKLRRVIRISAERIEKEPDVLEIIEMTKNAEAIDPLLQFSVKKFVSYISPATGLRINGKIDSTLTPRERTALAQNIWKGHFQNNPPMTG